jgi:formamidopyrimidine-DNA glycosylase
VPELPEVETIVRGLRPILRGRRVRAVWTSGLPLHLARPVDRRALEAVSVGHAFAGARRLGKYILLEVDAGDGLGVAVHLGMTGRLRVQASRVAREPHTHVVFQLDRGDELRFVDPRRFGWVAAGSPLSALPALAALGPDPLTALDAAALCEAMRGVRAPIKAFLLDQSRIAGIGNIYACEALHRAGVHPRSPAGRVWRRAAPLLDAIRVVLEGGIARRGTTLRDYVDSDGLPGDNAQALVVYGRAGEPCPRCAASIRRVVDSGRSTFYCPRCQRR